MIAKLIYYFIYKRSCEIIIFAYENTPSVPFYVLLDGEIYLFFNLLFVDIFQININDVIYYIISTLNVNLFIFHPF